MKKHVFRFVGCLLLAIVIGLSPMVWAAGDDDDNDEGGARRGRGRGLGELAWLIVRLTGEENWGYVGVIGPAGTGDEESSGLDDDF